MPESRKHAVLSPVPLARSEVQIAKARDLRHNGTASGT
jgi:hypothetical protein